jgi:hypothetical protein
MAAINVNLDVNRLIEYLSGLIISAINHTGKKQAEKKRLQEAANAVFKATAKEMYHNMAILGEQNYHELKKYAINTPYIKKIVQSLETTYHKQFETYIKQYKHLKKKEKAKIIDRISLALFKIDQMHKLTNMTKKDLETSHHRYRPAVRLQNIRKVYVEIKDNLK